MAEAQYEADEFLKLLTDALRAGPGSPAWHEALTRLRADNLSQAEEYRLLMTAREDLESGREYRGIRPGPEFTRKLMDRLDEEAAGRSRGIPTANIIAMASGLVIVLTIIIAAVILIKGHTPANTLGELSSTYFAKPIVSTDFAGGISSDWRRFGLEPVVTKDKGLRAAAQKGARDYKTGGIYLASPVATDKFAIEATVRMAKPTSQVYLRLFISDDPNPQAEQDAKAKAPREFVVELRNGELAAYKPDGKLAGSAASLATGAIPISIKMDRQNIIVETADKTLYAGPHGLPENAPRYPGLRFGARGEAGLENVTVQSIRILEP